MGKQRQKIPAYLVLLLLTVQTFILPMCVVYAKTVETTEKTQKAYADEAPSESTIEEGISLSEQEEAINQPANSENTDESGNSNEVVLEENYSSRDEGNFIEDIYDSNEEGQVQTKDTVLNISDNTKNLISNPNFIFEQGVETRIPNWELVSAGAVVNGLRRDLTISQTVESEEWYRLSDSSFRIGGDNLLSVNRTSGSRTLIVGQTIQTKAGYTYEVTVNAQAGGTSTDGILTMTAYNGVGVLAGPSGQLGSHFYTVNSDVGTYSLRFTATSNQTSIGFRMAGAHTILHSANIKPVLTVNSQVPSIPLAQHSEKFDYTKFIESVKIGNINLDDYQVELIGSLDTSSIGTKETRLKVSAEGISEETDVSYQVTWENSLGILDHNSSQTGISLSLLTDGESPYLQASFGEVTTNLGGNQTFRRGNFEFYHRDINGFILGLTTDTVYQSKRTLINTWNTRLNSNETVQYGDVVRARVFARDSPGSNITNTSLRIARNEALISEIGTFNEAYYMLTKGGYHLLRVNQLTAHSNISVPFGATESQMNELAKSFFTYHSDFSDVEKGQFEYKFLSYDSTNTSGSNKRGVIAATQTVDDKSFMLEYEVSFSVSEEQQYNLQLTASPVTGGNPATGSASIVQGGTTTINANPAEEYMFVRWKVVSGEGSVIEDEAAEDTDITMGSSDTIIQAIFEARAVPNPVDPINPEIEVEPENKPDLSEDQGMLSIDFVSSFNFGSQALSVHDQTYYAKPQRLLNEEGTVNEKEKRPNYVQISDRRSENERNGWTLAVTQKEQFNGEENQVLNGASLSLLNQQVITAQGDIAPGLQSVSCTLVPGNRQTLLQAQDNEGKGTWIYRFGDGKTAGESVALEVPRGANSEAITYSSTLIWELSTVPGN